MKTKLDFIKMEKAEVIEVFANRWMLAQKALNEIEDAFEYLYGSEKDRKKIYQILDAYTVKLKQE